EACVPFGRRSSRLPPQRRSVRLRRGCAGAPLPHDAARASRDVRLLACARTRSDDRTVGGASDAAHPELARTTLCRAARRRSLLLPRARPAGATPHAVRFYRARRHAVSAATVLRASRPHEAGVPAGGNAARPPARASRARGLAIDA